MLIIVEGPDCAGKTRLVDRLARVVTRRTGVAPQVTHSGPPTSHPLDEYERPLWGYLPGTGRHVICDRWHVGEAVYPAVLGRRTLMDGPVWSHVELFLRSRGALLVHVTANDVGALQACLRGRPRDGKPVDVGHLGDVWAGFDVAVRRSTLNLVQCVWDWDDDRLRHRFGVTLALGDVVDDAVVAEGNARPLAPFVTYVGPPRPDLLLLGDTRNVPDHGQPSPAFTPYHGTSGHYLLRALGDDARRVGLANACDVDDPIALWEALGRPPTVALGDHAASRLDTLGVLHGTTPHPQYWRRFLNFYKDDYARIIEQAASSGGDLRGWRPVNSWCSKDI